MFHVLFSALTQFLHSVDDDDDNDDAFVNPKIINQKYVNKAPTTILYFLINEYSLKFCDVWWLFITICHLEVYKWWSIRNGDTFLNRNPKIFW